MPLHDFRCQQGHLTEAYVPQGTDAISCRHCGERAEKVFLTFPMSFVQPDICYDSPIDGRPITSWQARKEDLARSGCIPYDPEMKKDAERKQKEAEARLEAAVDETVEREIAAMPVRKRERLAAEMEAGFDVTFVRK
jgi:hypothetical protein